MSSDGDGTTSIASWPKFLKATTPQFGPPKSKYFLYVVISGFDFDTGLLIITNSNGWSSDRVESGGVSQTYDLNPHCLKIDI